MGHRPRPAASSDAYTRPLFWLLLLCAIPIVVSQADNQTSNVSEVPSQDPPSSTASPPIVPCGGSRPFLCYAYQGLDQPFPEWLQQTEQKCQRCVASKNCGPNSQIGGQEDGNRLTVLSSCTPPFCKAEGNTSEAKVCVKAVNFDGKQPGKVFFPFNLCSREMVAFGDCNDKTLSKIRFAPTTGPLTFDYMVQCDAGFIIPSLVVNAGKDKGASTARPAMTCVPSLQQAAGYLKDDPSPLHHYPYDVADLKDFIYCEKGGRPNKTSLCEPLPLCIDGNKTLPTSPFTSDEVNLASECELPCKYQYGRKEYNDCVFLDIVNATARKFYSARRAMSGPYAELMDEEENVKVHIVPSTGQPPAETRHSRQTDSGEKIRYPRCINSTKLSRSDRKRVDDDLMLNCATNIFVQTFGDEGLIIQPPLCDGDDDNRICWNRTEPVTRNDNSLKPSDEWLPYWQYWAPSVLSVIVCGCGVYWWVRSGRTVALPLPADYKAASVTLETENITGSWLEPFDQRITSKPERRKRGRTIRFADEGHVALYVDPEAVPKAPVKPSATPPTASTAQQGAADQIVPPVTCADPADPSAVAKNILQIFAADTWMQKQESDVKRKEPLVKFDSAELLVLFNRATEIVGEHRGVVRIQGPVWFVGDLRNNLEDTWRIFKAYSEKADPATKMLFLGNVRDAAFKGLTSLSIIVASIVLYPKSVFYLCGQFEASDVQCSSHAALDTSIATFFANLPLFAIIDDRILSMHGGLGPELKPEDIRKGFEPTSTRATELRLDTLQSDPNCLVKDCAPKNDKTKGYFYGLTAIDDARRKFRIDYIIRARQATNLGLRFFGRWLISLFSTQQTTDQLTAVLQYGANSTFTALYLTKLGERYETQGVFEQKFDYQASTDRVFVDMDAVALSASPSTDLKTGENAPDPKTPKDA